MRWVLRLAVLAGVVAAAYLAVAGWMLARFAEGILRVGALADLAAAAEAPDDPLAMGYRGDPGAAFGAAFETWEIATDLGPAPAWYLPGDPGAPVAALYVHGIVGLRENAYRQVPLLRAAGIPVLLITYRNDAGAPAAPEGIYAFGLTEWRDVEAAAAPLAARGHDRILLMAASMGGGISGQFLARSGLADRVAAVALDSPALDFPLVVRHIAEARSLPAPGLVARVALAILARRLPLDLRGAAVIPVLAGFPGPLFLAHGTGDRIVPIETADRLLADRLGETLHLRTAEDHMESWREDPAAYDAAFRAFLARAAALP